MKTAEEELSNDGNTSSNLLNLSEELSWSSVLSVPSKVLGSGRILKNNNFVEE